MQFFHRNMKGEQYLGETFKGGRYTDVYKDGIAHEVKVGRQRLTGAIKTQIIKDLYLIEARKVDGVHWHFMISSATDSVGPSKDLLKFLKQHRIPYTIHVA